MTPSHLDSSHSKGAPLWHFLCDGLLLLCTFAPNLFAKTGGPGWVRMLYMQLCPLSVVKIEITCGLIFSTASLTLQPFALSKCTKHYSKQRFEKNSSVIKKNNDILGGRCTFAQLSLFFNQGFCVQTSTSNHHDYTLHFSTSVQLKAESLTIHGS